MPSGTILTRFLARLRPVASGVRAVVRFVWPNRHAWLLLVDSGALVVAGSFRSRDVSPLGAEEMAALMAELDPDFPFPFETIGELDLLIDATFSGVVRRDGRLFSTYDRSAPPQRRECPT